MSIIIRELVIRARLEEESSSTQTNGTESGVRTSLGESEIEHIVTLCVEKVMENLERKKER